MTAPTPPAEEAPRRGLRRLFGRNRGDDNRASGSIFNPVDWYLAFRRWRAGRALARRRAAVLPNAAQRTRSTAALVAKSRMAARADVSSGMYDEWTFSDRWLPEHIVELRARADQETAAVHADLSELERFEREHFSGRAADGEVLAQRLDLLQQLHDESRQMSRRTLARLDRLATRQARRREILRYVPRRRRRQEDREDYRSPRELAEAHDAPPDQEALRQLGMLAETEQSPWEGPQAPPIRWPMRTFVLIGLILVEVPITFIVFQFFHGRETQLQIILTAIFAIPIAFLMVLVPHIAGRFYRYRQATGGEWLAILFCLVTVGPWAYLAYWLGTLRARVLVVEPGGAEPVDPALPPLPTLASQLNIDDATLSRIFVSVMIITGVIGFLLGLAHEHPLQAAFRGARRERLRLERRLARMGLMGAAGQMPTAEELQARQNDSERAIHASYAAAEHAYLDAVARAMGNPAATEAIARMSDRLANERELPEQEAVR